MWNDCKRQYKITDFDSDKQCSQKNLVRNQKFLEIMNKRSMGNIAPISAT